MKKYKSKKKNLAYFLYRLIRPVIDPIKIAQGIVGYLWFTRDLIVYKLKSPGSKLLNLNLFPILDEKVSFTPFDAHYYYQQLWCFEQILKSKPRRHIDIGSTYEMSGYLSKVVATTFIDYRPIQTRLKNLRIKRGDILNLKLKDSSVESLSCLHTVEHIGLGRYGDPIDPNGTKNACRELVRILERGGKLYLSVPIGKEAIYFNAHRVHRPQTILKYCKGLTLKSFSVVDDLGNFHTNTDFRKYARSDYACGMFEFVKKR